MSFPRLVLLGLCLPLLVGGCGAAAVTAASYGADGVSLVDSGKTTTDHFASMVSRKDCAFWRVFRKQSVCRPREGDNDPYKVDYDSAGRQPSEDGVAYAPPLHASAEAPASSWTAEAYKPAAAPVPAPASEAVPTPEPATAVADVKPPPQPEPPPKAASHKPVKKKAKAHAKAKKPSQGQVASVP